MFEVLSVLADYFIYVFLMLVLAFRTYRSIHVLKSKTVINKAQFWVYMLILLAGTLLLAVDRDLFVFRIIATVIFVVMVVLEAKDLGRIETILETRVPPKPEKVTDDRKKRNGRLRQEKKSMHPALKSARRDFFLTIVIAVLSFVNIFGVWTVLLIGS